MNPLKNQKFPRGGKDMLGPKIKLINKREKMIIDNYTKLILAVLAVALLLNGINPWVNPTPVWAIENSTTRTKNIDSSCFSKNKVATQTLDGVTNAERLLGYIESSVNDIKLTIKGIDRKLSVQPARIRIE